MSSYTLGVFEAKRIIEYDGWPLFTVMKRNDGDRFFIHRLKDGRNLIHHVEPDVIHKVTSPHLRYSMREAITTSKSHYILDQMEWDQGIKLFKVDATPISIHEIDENILPAADAFHTWM